MKRIYPDHGQYRSTLKARYGMTLEEYQDFKKGNCEICGRHYEGQYGMVVDHNKKGSYRGLLCRSCNGRLGWLERYRIKIWDYVDFYVRFVSVTTLVLEFITMVLVGILVLLELWYRF